MTVSTSIRIALSLLGALLALPAPANDKLCASIRPLAAMAQSGFDGADGIVLHSADECGVEEGEFGCFWYKVRNPAERAAALGRDVAACFPGATVQKLDALNMHVVKTEAAIITVIGGQEDKTVMLMIKY